MSPPARVGQAVEHRRLDAARGLRRIDQRARAASRASLLSIAATGTFENFGSAT